MKFTKSQIVHEDCLEFMKNIEDKSVQLIITSPPYNVGKEYERKAKLQEYLKWKEQVISECVRILKPTGSIFWQVGNYIDNGEVYPLDILLYPLFMKFDLHLRNRIVWHFGHGLHCSKRFSGRHETILWFTKTDDYVFNLDEIRIPQKYPNKKAYKGENKGKLSSNPLGKNPSDVWDFSNVKHNHPEKTHHPCQFPESMIERIVKVGSNKKDIIFDPFVGSGTTVVVAEKLGRIGIGTEIVKEYIDIANKRLKKTTTQKTLLSISDSQNGNRNIQVRNPSLV